MELETNLNELSSWTSNFTKKKLAFIGTGVLVATAVCISVIVAVSVKSSSAKASLTLSTLKEKINLMKNEVQWVSYSSENYNLTNAFAGGTGVNGKTVYVCRAKHPAKLVKVDEVIPGTFDPTDATCKVPYDDKANTHRNFDLLIIKNPSRLVWQQHKEQDKKVILKMGTVTGGYTAYNEELYVTRFEYYGYDFSKSKYNYYTVLGKLHLAHSKASGPADGRERYSEDYDLLSFADYAL